jgi:hypothetical protein
MGAKNPPFTLCTPVIHPGRSHRVRAARWQMPKANAVRELPVTVKTIPSSDLLGSGLT